MTTSRIPPELIGGLVAHKPKGQPYAFGSNREFVRDTSRSMHDYEGVDVDATCTLDDVPMWNHWEDFIRKDAWHDRRGVLGNSARMGHTKYAQLRHVAVKYQGAQRPMLNVKQAAIFMRQVRPRRLIPCIEVKQSHQFLDLKWWAWFDRWMAGLPYVIMSLPGRNGIGYRRLQAAKQGANAPTMILYRGGLPAGIGSYVDLVKSKPGNPRPHLL